MSSRVSALKAMIQLITPNIISPKRNTKRFARSYMDKAVEYSEQQLLQKKFMEYIQGSDGQIKEDTEELHKGIEEFLKDVGNVLHSAEKAQFGIFTIMKEDIEKLKKASDEIKKELQEENAKHQIPPQTYQENMRLLTEKLDNCFKMLHEELAEFERTELAIARERQQLRTTFMLKTDIQIKSEVGHFFFREKDQEKDEDKTIKEIKSQIKEFASGKIDQKKIEAEFSKLEEENKKIISLCHDEFRDLTQLIHKISLGVALIFEKMIKEYLRGSMWLPKSDYEIAIREFDGFNVMVERRAEIYFEMAKKLEQETQK